MNSNLSRVDTKSSRASELNCHLSRRAPSVALDPPSPRTSPPPQPPQPWVNDKALGNRRAEITG